MQLSSYSSSLFLFLLVIQHAAAFTQNMMEYRLQGNTTCFKWPWDHHNVLSEFEAARLGSIEGQKSGGMALHMKLYIDKISNIQISQKSGDLRVSAFDSGGNMLSSLVGDCLVHDSDWNSDIEIKLEEGGGSFAEFYVVKATSTGYDQVVSVNVVGGGGGGDDDDEYLADKILSKSDILIRAIISGSGEFSMEAGEDSLHLNLTRYPNNTTAVTLTGNTLFHVNRPHSSHLIATPIHFDQLPAIMKYEIVTSHVNYPFIFSILLRY